MATAAAAAIRHNVFMISPPFPLRLLVGRGDGGVQNGPKNFCRGVGAVGIAGGNEMNLDRHARAWRGHPRLFKTRSKTWMAGTRPGHDARRVEARPGWSGETD